MNDSLSDIDSQATFVDHTIDNCVVSSQITTPDYPNNNNLSNQQEEYYEQNIDDINDVEDDYIPPSPQRRKRRNVSECTPQKKSNSSSHTRSKIGKQFLNIIDLIKIDFENNKTEEYIVHRTTNKKITDYSLATNLLNTMASDVQNLTATSIECEKLKHLLNTSPFHKQQQLGMFYKK